MLVRNQGRKKPFPSYEITLTNISENEAFCYSLPVVKGYVSGVAQKTVVDEGTIVLKRLGPSDLADEVTNWPVVNGHFKCLANLDPGRNRFVLQFEDSRLHLNLEFQPKTTKHHVLPVYIICEGNEGRFQAPSHEDNSPQSACRRISLGSRLIQSLTAEKLHESDLGRRTFQLARDMGIGMDCLVFHSRLTPQEVYEMEPEEIWEHFGRELMSSAHGAEERKFLAFLSCTRYVATDDEPETHEEVVARMRGHVALGGGGLAVFGTGCLHTWPETIDQVLPRFLDGTKVDKMKFMDDSCYRGTYGSCFSTTLGAVCHELGHAFDLGHSKRGIMGRGFDNISLVFTTSTHSKDANKNVIVRHEAQHATVSFTRDLSVTYTVSSPIKRPRGHHHHHHQQQQQQQQNKPFARQNPASACTATAWNSSFLLNCDRAGDEKRQIAYFKAYAEDLTFWERSCAVLLRYHKWFSDEDGAECATPSIEYDQDRNIVYAASGIRVIELRRDDGLVLTSWEFTSTYIPKQFNLPLQNMNVKEAKMVVAEDSSGNIIKEYLVV